MPTLPPITTTPRLPILDPAPANCHAMDVPAEMSLQLDWRRGSEHVRAQAVAILASIPASQNPVEVADIENALAGVDPKPDLTIIGEAPAVPKFASQIHHTESKRDLTRPEMLLPVYHQVMRLIDRRYNSYEQCQGPDEIITVRAFVFGLTMLLFVVAVLWSETSAMKNLTMEASVSSLARVRGHKPVTVQMFQKRNIVRIINGALLCLCFSWTPITCFMRSADSQIGSEGVSNGRLSDIAMYQAIVMSLWVAFAKVVLKEEVLVSSPVPNKVMDALKRGPTDLKQLEEFLEQLEDMIPKKCLEVMIPKKGKSTEGGKGTENLGMIPKTVLKALGTD